MINDRQLNISVGGSRKAIDWQRQAIHWSDLCEKLRLPARGTETMGAYLSLPKARQDELKDVGGFVGGTLSGPRRKASNVEGRDVLTLDLDNIPPGDTDAVLRRVAALGCGYCAYSTRKHRGDAPRLRVLIMLHRTCTADEYTPLARKVADHIGMTFCDPTTFEASRLMYWPSCCSDGAYVHQFEDKPLLDVDGTLAQYADWRDVSSWPRAQGETPIQRLADKQGDPTQKSGVVGAFCRIYDIPAAIDAYIPSSYARTDVEDRFTYTGGSTTGGAVLYDHDAFLFSHHATDPCSGKLVNAFDLVRLHLFGEMDDEAKPDTPSHKLPSFKAMAQRAEQDAQVQQLLLEQRGEALLADFAGVAVGPNREGLAQYLAALEGKTLTTHIVHEVLIALGVTLRLNEITGSVALVGYPVGWSRENAENNLPVLLRDLLRPAGVVGVSKDAICDSLDLIADEGRFNPIKDMCAADPWDGADRLQDVYDILGVADAFDLTLIRKWLIQCIAMALNDENEPYGADGVLTLVGGQGVGKTSFFMQISPFRALAKDGINIDPTDKDTIIRALSYWISELGELERTTRKDHASLKALITAPDDTYRSPYARRAVRRIRRTSFGGTVNGDAFLSDETGNRRFWTVRVESVDLGKLYALEQAWKTQLWAQVYQLFLANEQGFRLTREERERLNIRNREYAAPLDYELEIRALFDMALPLDQWGWFTSTQVSAMLPNRPPANRLGRALGKIAREVDGVGKRVLDGCPRYLLPLRKIEVSSGA